MSNIRAFANDSDPELKKLLLKAKAMSFSSHPTEAVDTYKQVLAKYPNSSEAYAGLGWISFQGGRLPMAIKYLQKSITLDPLNAEPHFYLAAIYNSQRQYQTSEKQLLIAKDLAAKRPCDCGHQLKVIEQANTPNR